LALLLESFLLDDAELGVAAIRVEGDVATTEAPLARIRQPQPFLTRRVRSGRGATEQPNAAGDDAELSLCFWLMVAVTGIAAGLGGMAMIAILHGVQHLAYGYHGGDVQTAVARTAGSRRILALAAGGVVTGVGWYLLRRFMSDQRSDLDDALWAGDSQLSMRRSFLTSVLSEIAVGVGASLGLEAAPKLLGAAAGSLLARWTRLDPTQRRLLVACGGGAGMAAVYNVPLGGALITAEVLYGSLALPVVLPALACSAIATATSWIYLPDRPTYLLIPTYHVSAALAVWSVPAGLLIGVLTVGYVRLIGLVSVHRPNGWRVCITPAIAFTLLGFLALAYPQVLGNGRDMASPAFLGAGTAGLLLILAVLKPFATMLCLGSGATGGLFTPTLATGAVLGGALGIAWSQVWPGAPAGAFALVGAAAMVGAGLQAPLAGLVLVLELTGTTNSLAVPILVATVLATAVARYLDGYSIYSVRLPAR
jgi:CIC family chloride channel protein